MELGKSWKKKAILFLGSQCVTLFGSSLVQFAIVWYVTLTTSSGTLVSALTVCSFLPQMLISFVSGVWADRYSKKALIILADGVIALATLALALMMPHLGNSALIPALMAVSVIRSIGAGVQLPAVNAVIPALVPEAQLMRFNGINAAIQSVVQFLAPAAAGAILTFGTLRSTLMIDVGTAIVGVGLLCCIALPKRQAEKAGAQESLLADLKSGMRYAFLNPFLGKLLFLYGLFIFLCVPAGFLATLFVSRTYGDSYSYLTIVELVGFAGMAAGGALLGAWGGFSNRVRTLLFGLGSFGLLAFAMGAIKSFIVYLVLMVVLGVALTMVQTAVTTLIQEKSAPDMQGRVFGFLGTMYSGFLPIGMAVFGPLADHVSLRILMMVSGALLTIAAIVCRAQRAFYAAGEKPAKAAAGAGDAAQG